jgi:hypothetical protein
MGPLSDLTGLNNIASESRIILEGSQALKPDRAQFSERQVRLRHA